MHKKKLTLLFLIFAAAIVLGAVFRCAPSKTNEQQLKAEIGRHLFYDNRLSINQTRSCASCHNPKLAFTDGYKKTFGALADMHEHNTLSLFNLSSFQFYNYADTNLRSIEQQMLQPLFGKHPVEMGMNANDATIIKTLFESAVYHDLIQALPNKNNIDTWQFAIQCIAEFLQKIQSFSSPYDSFLIDQTQYLDGEARKGMTLFFSKELACAQCHGGANFSKPSITNLRGDSLHHFFHFETYRQFENSSKGATAKQYRVPSLRNLSFTKPYFHDGQALNLNEVMAYYQDTGFVQYLFLANEIRTKNAPKALSKEEAYLIIKFLKSLDDSSLLNNKAIANPFDKSPQ